jgi:hypothetical protein
VLSLSLETRELLLAILLVVAVGPQSSPPMATARGDMIPPSESDIKSRLMMECDFFPKSSGPHESAV